MPNATFQSEIEDLVDFYNRWPVLRKEAQAVLEISDLTSAQASVLSWMIFVVDRVGPADLATPEE